MKLNISVSRTMSHTSNDMKSPIKKILIASLPREALSGGKESKPTPPQARQQDEQCWGRWGRGPGKPPSGRDPAKLPGSFRSGLRSSQPMARPGPQRRRGLGVQTESGLPGLTSTHALRRITPPALSARNRPAPASPDPASEPRPTPAPQQLL